MELQIEPIGTVRGGRNSTAPDGWDAERCLLALDPERFTPDALTGLDSYSHAEVVYYFDRVPDEKITLGAHHPRNNPNWPLTGIFAQRGPHRPNRLGVSICRIIGVTGLDVEVVGLDAIDGTPILDIKPVLREFLPGAPFASPSGPASLWPNTGPDGRQATSATCETSNGSSLALLQTRTPFRHPSAGRVTIAAT